MLRELIEPVYERYLTSQCKHIPNHIAIIQDGNRRYAKLKRKAISFGHEQGADRTEKVLEWSQELGIRYITLYIFSTENFNRGDQEVDALFDLFKEKLTSILKNENIHKFGVKIQMIGDRDLLPADLLDAVEKAEAVTAHYDNYILNMAMAYGGQNEIVQATKKILGDINSQKILKNEITPELFESYLYGSDITIPPVDLIIRTGNEYRTSNFLPWLANGHESAVYFCAPYWPMFRKIDLLRAVRVFSQRREIIAQTL